MKLNQGNKALLEFLSFKQLKYDCETVLEIIKKLPVVNPVTALGLIPYITLTTCCIEEILPQKDAKLIPISKKLHETRSKLKLFEKGYGASIKEIIAIDSLMDQYFRKMALQRKQNEYYNIGIYADSNGHVIGNTQLYFYFMGDKKVIKEEIGKPKVNNCITSVQNNLINKINKEAFEYAKGCGQLINIACQGLDNLGHCSVEIADNCVKYSYVDLNTNQKSGFFPFPDSENINKGLILYFLHILSFINFLLYNLKGFEKEDHGWWLKVSYITYYSSIMKLRSFQNYYNQNKEKISNSSINAINDLIKKTESTNNGLMNKDFRNNVMHPKLYNPEKGSCIISEKYFSLNKPLYGLVESCFDGRGYTEIKDSIDSALYFISGSLSQIITVKSLHFQLL